MKLLKYACGLLLSVAASQAAATSYAWCEMSGGNYESYLSAIVQIEDGREAFRAFLQGPFAKGFREHVQASIDPRASSLDCTREDSLLFANDRIDVLINANPGIKFVKTGWRGPVRSAVAHDQPKPRPASGKLLATKSKVAAPKPTDNAEPKQLRQEASATLTPATPSQKAMAPGPVDSAATKPQWELDYERKMAVYEEELARQQHAVADFEKMKADTAAKKVELRAKAEKATAEWKAAVAACKAGNHSACRGNSPIGAK